MTLQLLHTEFTYIFFVISVHACSLVNNKTQEHAACDKNIKYFNCSPSPPFMHNFTSITGPSFLASFLVFLLSVQSACRGRGEEVEPKKTKAKQRSIFSAHLVHALTMQVYILHKVVDIIYACTMTESLF
jgi:hypothetical protein